MPAGHLRLCFFAERQVGYNSVAGVVQKYLSLMDGVELTWADVTYVKPGGLIERLPSALGSARGVARGFLQTGAGLRQGPFDVLFFFSHNPAVFRTRAMKLTPACVWTDATPLQYNGMNEAYGRKPARKGLIADFKRFAVTRTFSIARRCLAWSEWARRSYLNDYGVPEERTAIVRPGVDLERWRVPARAAPDAARELRLLFVGGNFARKGGAVLLDVFRSSLRGRCTLDVVTRDEIAPEPGVRVHRGLSVDSPELAALYRDADAFVLPTLADCHSIASLEAMACGLPVISTRVGAIPEIIEHERSGFLIDPGAAKPLGDAILALCADRARARAMGVAGRALVEQRFDARDTAREILHQAKLAAAGKARREPQAG